VDAGARDPDPVFELLEMKPWGGSLLLVQIRPEAPFDLG
jgi:hypothetical protein